MKDEMMLFDYINPEYLTTGRKLNHKFAICGFFNTGDIFVDYADNEEDFEYYVNRISENPTIHDFIVVNRIGQLVYSTYSGFRNMKFPKYFRKYLQERLDQY